MSPQRLWNTGAIKMLLLESKTTKDTFQFYPKCPNAGVCLFPLDGDSLSTRVIYHSSCHPWKNVIAGLGNHVPPPRGTSVTQVSYTPAVHMDKEVLSQGSHYLGHSPLNYLRTSSSPYDVFVIRVSTTDTMRHTWTQRDHQHHSRPQTPVMTCSFSDLAGRGSQHMELPT